jgi:NAD(P)-dependent dehydrogenase (short-subunit alcohol dehydrogenase family)
MKLNGKTALVTGAADRIGAAIAVSLAEEGAGIIIHYNSSEKKAAETAQKIKDINAQCITSQHDLSVTSKTKKWFRNLMEKTGGIDILVNSASLYTRDSYFDISEKEINYSMKIHFYSPLIMIREMYKYHKERAEYDNTGNNSLPRRL